MDAGDIDHRRRQLLLPRRHPARQARSRTPASTTSTVGTSGGVWGLDRGYCLMIGGEDRGRRAARPDLQDARARRRLGGAHARPHRRARAGRAGLPALRPERRRALREDGPQRHRVRDDGRLRRGPEHPASTPTSASDQRRGRRRDHAAARTRVLPVRHRHHRGRRGLAARQRGRLLAARPDRRGAGRVPQLAEFAGRVSDSGEGRWTSIAAIDEGVPAPVLTAALYERFASRGLGDFADKILSAMRKGSAATTRRRPTAELLQPYPVPLDRSTDEGRP
jgi:6-phosphogluconate dehydrogenase